MRKTMYLTVLLLLAALAFLCARAEKTGIEPSPGTVTLNGAVLRGEPTRAVPPLVSLNAGDIVTVTGIVGNNEGMWYKAEFSRNDRTYEGYIFAENVLAELKDENGETVRIPVPMRVSAAAACGAFNHVGYNWERKFYLNGEAFAGARTILLCAGDTVTLGAYLCENDSYPDSTRENVRRVISQSDLVNGFTVSFPVSVSENRGRYSGYSCTWQVTFYFTRG